MIHPDEIYRLVQSIVRYDDAATGDAYREHIVEIAGANGLDLQDTATLYRVASGEGMTTNAPLPTLPSR